MMIMIITLMAMISITIIIIIVIIIIKTVIIIINFKIKKGAKLQSGTDSNAYVTTRPWITACSIKGVIVF